MTGVPDFANIKSDAEYIAPVTDEEKLIVALMQKVLKVHNVGLNDSFFDLGGDSLSAIEFICEVQDKGIDLEVQDVFDCPTAALMAKHITDGKRETVQYNAEDFGEIHRLLRKNIISEKEFPMKQSLGNALMTGATGWLGVHVLDEFLSCESGIAYCLVRGHDYAESKRKFDESLMYYFGDKYAQADRIVVICSDITRKILMNESVRTIIHCAANVKHYGSYQHSFDVNVTGTKNVIALAKEKGARLLHISTIAVSGSSFNQNVDFPDTIFDETKLFVGQPLENVYVRSKFEAEVAVLQAKLDGLEAAVARVGNLSNRQADLRFQKNRSENATLTRLRAFVGLGLYPEEMAEFPFELSPVDCTTQAIMKLAQYIDEEYSVFHEYNNNKCNFGY